MNEFEKKIFDSLLTQLKKEKSIGIISENDNEVNFRVNSRVFWLLNWNRRICGHQLDVVILEDSIYSILNSPNQHASAIGNRKNGYFLVIEAKDYVEKNIKKKIAEGIFIKNYLMQPDVSIIVRQNNDRENYKFTFSWGLNFSFFGIQTEKYTHDFAPNVIKQFLSYSSPTRERLKENIHSYPKIGLLLKDRLPEGRVEGDERIQNLGREDMKKAFNILETKMLYGEIKSYQILVNSEIPSSEFTDLSPKSTVRNNKLDENNKLKIDCSCAYIDKEGQLILGFCWDTGTLEQIRKAFGYAILTNTQVKIWLENEMSDTHKSFIGNHLTCKKKIETIDFFTFVKENSIRKYGELRKELERIDKKKLCSYNNGSYFEYTILP